MGVPSLQIESTNSDLAIWHNFVALDGLMWKLIHDNHTKRFSSSTAANMISDVYDGVEYKKNIHLNEVGNISFIVNTDGVAIIFISIF